MNKKKKRSGALRLGIQISVFGLVALIAAGNWLSERGIAIPFLPDASLHAVCPFGGVVTVYEFVTAGTFIQKIHSSSFILMLLGLAVAILFGTVFCGYICPFGSLQEWIGKLGKKLFPGKYNRAVPERLDRVLRYFRYAALAAVLSLTAVSAKLVFQAVDPYYALFNLFSTEVAATALAVLIAVAVLSLIVERPWCKYFCPYGALLGLFNKVRIFKLRRNPDTCIGCNKCDRACPMNIRVSEKSAVGDLSCISCHLCTSEEACPVKDTVIISAGAKKKEGALHEA